MTGAAILKNFYIYFTKSQSCTVKSRTLTLKAPCIEERSSIAFRARVPVSSEYGLRKSGGRVINSNVALLNFMDSFFNLLLVSL